MKKTLICSGRVSRATGFIVFRGTFDLATFTVTDEISGAISSVGS